MRRHNVQVRPKIAFSATEDMPAKQKHIIKRPPQETAVDANFHQ
jgi:hypothetical protein